jgi:signal transduction histidine kinase/ligand-binding sensor domain-containing protein
MHSLLQEISAISILKKWRIVLWLITLTYSLGLSSQPLPANLVTYTLPDGLPDNHINAIAQDKFGYTWVGTANGLTRFDGKYFTEFSNLAKMKELPSQEILSIRNLDSNQLVVATRFGISIIDVQMMANRNLIIPARPGETQIAVNKICEVFTDKNGSLFITSRSGFYHYNRKQELLFRHDDYPANYQGSRGFGVFTLWLNDDYLLIAGQNQLYVYHIPSRVLTPAKTYEREFLTIALIQKYMPSRDIFFFQSGKQILAVPYNENSLIYIDEFKKQIVTSKIPLDSAKSLFTWRSNLFKINDSTLYLSGKFKGLYKIRVAIPANKLILDTAAQFSLSKCNFIFTDRRSRYWLGFSDGLKMEKKSPINLMLNPSAGLYEPPIQRNPILQVAVSEKYLYAVSSVSKGAYRFKKSTLEFDKHLPFSFPPFGNNTIFAVQKWHGDTVLFGSDCGLFLYKEGNEKATYIEMPEWDPARNWVSSVYIDKRKNAWILGNMPKGCYLWKYGDSKPGWFSFAYNSASLLSAYNMVEDQNGHYWFSGKGLARYNTKENKIDYLIDSISTPVGVITALNSIETDHNGQVWMCSASGGLICLNPENRRIRTFYKADGLPDYKVSAIHYNNGYIWIICKNGISKIHTSSYRFTNLCTLSDFYYKQLFSTKLTYDSLTKNYYTGSGSSIISFQSAHDSFKPEGPKLLLVYTKYNGDSIIWYPNRTLTLHWKNRNATLLVNAVNYDDAAYQRYAYRLINGTTSEWIQLDDQRLIVLTGLKAGTTTVEIKVFSPQHAWPSKTLSYNIIIVPPFWRTPWFLLACFTTAIFSIYGIAKYRSNQKRKLLLIRENIAKDLHDEIGATLSGIAMYSHMVKANLAHKKTKLAEQAATIIQESATEMVGKLSDIVWLIKPKNESMDALTGRLVAYANDICAAKNIKNTISITDEAAHCIPTLQQRKNIYLICKEAINNAAKYSEATALKMEFQIQAKHLIISIADNGKGYDPAGITNGNGLDNIYSRATEMDAELHIDTQPGNGCRVELKLKITHLGIGSGKRKV